MNVLDRQLISDVSARLKAPPATIEKDWYMTHAIAVLAAMEHGGAVPAFGGGTSLSKGWKLIKRFSEDIDFKVAMPPPVSRNKAKAERSDYRRRVLAALGEAGFALQKDPFVRDESRFFSADLLYPTLFETGHGLRPHLRVEMSLAAPAQTPTARPIASLVSLAQGKAPEVDAFFCVDPAETAADKLSALAWRIPAYRRGNGQDDPTIVRHLHDLAALKESVINSTVFGKLVSTALAEDKGRGGNAIPQLEPEALFATLLDRLGNDPFWAVEYERYVRQVSFATEGIITFEQAFASLHSLLASLEKQAGLRN